MNFPNDWPTGCPPSDSETASGVVYRIVNSDPVQNSDFLSQFELGRAMNPDECLRRSLSVYTALADAEHRRRLTPKLGRLVARATLDESHGKMKHTGGQKSSHTEWWPCEGIDRKAGFTVVG
jgi:hypothetical protein